MNDEKARVVCVACIKDATAAPEIKRNQPNNATEALRNWDLQELSERCAERENWIYVAKTQHQRIKQSENKYKLQLKAVNNQGCKKKTGIVEARG